MADRDPFPLIENVLVVLLSDLVGEDPEADPTTFTHIGTATPPTLQDAMPYLRVQRFGGTDDGWTDAALVSIDAFAAVRLTAHALAESVRQRLLTGPNVAAGATVDKSTTQTAPNEVPWSDDQKVRRITASYRVTARR